MSQPFKLDLRCQTFVIIKLDREGRNSWAPDGFLISNPRQDQFDELFSEQRLDRVDLGLCFPKCMLFP